MAAAATIPARPVLEQQVDAKLYADVKDVVRGNYSSMQNILASVKWKELSDVSAADTILVPDDQSVFPHSMKIDHDYAVPFVRYFLVKGVRITTTSGTPGEGVLGTLDAGRWKNGGGLADTNVRLIDHYTSDGAHVMERWSVRHVLRHKNSKQPALVGIHLEEYEPLYNSDRLPQLVARGGSGAKVGIGSTPTVIHQHTAATGAALGDAIQRHSLAKAQHALAVHKRDHPEARRWNAQLRIEHAIKLKLQKQLAVKSRQYVLVATPIDENLWSCDAEATSLQSGALIGRRQSARFANATYAMVVALSRLNSWLLTTADDLERIKQNKDQFWTTFKQTKVGADKALRQRLSIYRATLVATLRLDDGELQRQLNKSSDSAKLVKAMNLSVAAFTEAPPETDDHPLLSAGLVFALGEDNDDSMRVMARLTVLALNMSRHIDDGDKLPPLDRQLLELFINEGGFRVNGSLGMGYSVLPVSAALRVEEAVMLILPSDDEFVATVERQVQAHGRVIDMHNIHSSVEEATAFGDDMPHHALPVVPLLSKTFFATSMLTTGDTLSGGRAAATTFQVGEVLRPDTVQLLEAAALQHATASLNALGNATVLQLYARQAILDVSVVDRSELAQPSGLAFFQKSVAARTAYEAK